MPSTYTTGFIKRAWNMEQPHSSGDKYGQRFVGTSGAMLEIGAGAVVRNLNLATSTAGAAQHSTLNPDGLNVLMTSGVYLLNPYRGSHAVIVSYNTENARIKGDPAVDMVHFSLWTSTAKTTHPHVISIKCTSQQGKTMGAWLDVYGVSTHYGLAKYMSSSSVQRGDAFSSSTGA